MSQSKNLKNLHLERIKSLNTGEKRAVGKSRGLNRPEPECSNIYIDANTNVQCNGNAIRSTNLPAAVLLKSAHGDRMLKSNIPVEPIWFLRFS